MKNDINKVISKWSQNLHSRGTALCNLLHGSSDGDRPWTELRPQLRVKPAGKWAA